LLPRVKPPAKLFVPFRDNNLLNEAVPKEWLCQKRHILKAGIPSRLIDEESSYNTLKELNMRIA